MVELALLSRLRAQMKQFQRTGRAKPLVDLARNSLLTYKSAKDLFQIPPALRRLKKDLTGRTPADCVELVFDRFGGLLQPYQNRWEIGQAIQRAATLRPNNVLEIGTARGGTLLLLSRAAAPDAALVSIDLPGGMYGGGYPAWKGRFFRWMIEPRQTLHLLRMNSHDQKTVDEAGRRFRGAVDLLFIDADHSYAGVKRDFFLYRELVREGGLIFFHDILENRFDPDISVAPFWNELRENYQTEEIVENRQQGVFGIGVVVAPHVWPKEIST
jgi:predicted O-methyltransferase YrrM